jgi:hypothetical protein
LRFTATEPREELLKALLLDLRPLVVLGDGANIRAVSGIAERRLTSDRHRRALRDGLQAWRDAQRHGVFALRIDERDLPPELVMRLWVDWYFHPTPANRGAVQELLQPGGMLSRQVFLDYVYRAIDCVVWTASVLEDAIKIDALEP